ncbi:MAG: flagellar hook-basal body complex protein, partial [Pseudomonadota bacterium]
LALSRQTGLRKEMQAVANNIANMSTAGFKRESVIFAETLRALPVEGGSISMTEARVRRTDFAQGALERTGGTFDLAIEGEGFFRVQTPGGPRLTRNGAFTRDAQGALVTMDGYPVLDPGGAAVFAPPGATSIAIDADGAVSADGQPVSALAVVTPEDPADLRRESGVLFIADGPLRPAPEAGVLQGFLEGGNVSPVSEMTRMIEVQRAYELSRDLLDREDQRIRAAIRQLGGGGG